MRKWSDVTTLFTFLWMLLGVAPATATAIEDPEAALRLADSLASLSYNQLAADLYRSRDELKRALVLSQEPGNRFDDARRAGLHANLGVIYHLLNKPGESLEQHLQAIARYESEGMTGKAGNVYAQLGYSIKSRDMSKALDYMRRGILRQEQAEDSGLSTSYDNYGVLLDMTGRADSALWYFKRSLEMKRVERDVEGIPYSLHKIATVQAREGAVTEAMDNLNEALVLALSIGDTLILAECWTYYGDVYLQTGDLRNAERSYKKALDLATRSRVDYLVKYLYDKLPELYADLGDPGRAYAFLKEGMELRDSILTSERVRTIAEMEIYFETRQKEQKINMLEKEVTLSALQLRFNRRVMALGTVGIVLSLGVFFLWRKQQKLRYEADMARQQEILQKERLKSVILGEERERERMARELHDGLGQVLSAARMHVSCLEEDAPAALKGLAGSSCGLIDQACREVREISHALLPSRVAHGHLGNAIADLVRQVESTGKLSVKLEIEENILGELSGERAVAVYRMLQEMLNNTLKHSQADLIALDIRRGGGSITILYSDNGTGFEPSVFMQSRGIGWANISSRVEMIGASIQIGRSGSGGFSAKTTL